MAILLATRCYKPALLFCFCKGQKNSIFQQYRIGLRDIQVRISPCGPPRSFHLALSVWREDELYINQVICHLPSPRRKWMTIFTSNSWPSRRTAHARNGVKWFHVAKWTSRIMLRNFFPNFQKPAKNCYLKRQREIPVTSLLLPPSSRDRYAAILLPHLLTCE